MGQFCPGFHSDNAIPKSSYNAVAKFSGEYTRAMDMLEKAVKAWAMHLTLALNSVITKTTTSMQVHSFNNKSMLMHAAQQECG